MASSIETVSVVTITQRKRFPVLQLLARLLLNQTRQPDEWVITEGSQTSEDAAENQVKVETLRAVVPFPIVYVPYVAGTKLGGLRNRGNNACTCEIIVCMDDDDYYPVKRIEHAVERFREFPDRDIAGCSNLLVYDFGSRAFYQCKGFHENHSTNNAMAWRKRYLTKHRHDDSKTHAEEASFTNNFTEPMITLLPLLTVVTASHTQNTFDKRTIIKNNVSFNELPTNLIFQIMTLEHYKWYADWFQKQTETVFPPSA